MSTKSQAQIQRESQAHLLIESNIPTISPSELLTPTDERQVLDIVNSYSKLIEENARAKLKKLKYEEYATVPLHLPSKKNIYNTLFLNYPLKMYQQGKIDKKKFLRHLNSLLSLTDEFSKGNTINVKYYIDSVMKDKVSLNSF